MNEQTLFTEALAHPPGERAAFLRDVCGDDGELLARIERLIELHEQAGTFMNRPAVEPLPTQGVSVAEPLGSRIGPYKLLQLIGEGGMGLVYMAEQAEPIARRVALKIMKPGLDSRQVIARFEAERQALSLMDHPHIAKVLDAGATDRGLPFFAMELVNGIPVTEFCDQQHLTMRERLELFIPICQAVQHAHQKGIIHRDLKPSNILVALYDGRPVPKVIDFGVAKAVHQPLTEKTMFTMLGQIVGTLEYMSPEQAQRNQLDIDTRSDIYSLGVVLYELLTGDTPFDRKRLRSAALDELLRIIREEEPIKPSTRISGSDQRGAVAVNRRSDPAKLSLLVRGELDWIVMKALDKDRSRRYETANGLAMDIQRFLSDEPVTAGPPTATYRLRKFARRHRRMIGISLVGLVLLVGGTIGTTWQAVQATRQRNRAVAAEVKWQEAADRAAREARRANEEAALARTAASVATAVVEFVQGDLLGQAHPNAQLDPDVTLRAVVERAAERAGGRFADQPLVEAAVWNTLGIVYHGLGDYATAEQYRRRSVEIRQRELGAEHRDTLGARNGLASTLRAQSRYDDAETMHRETLETQRRVLGPRHEDTLISQANLAVVLMDQHRYAEAESLLRQTLEAQRRSGGEDDRAALRTASNLADVLMLQDKLAESELLHRDVWASRERVLGRLHPDTLASQSNVAMVAQRLGRSSEAEGLHRRTLEARRQSLGDEHPDTIDSMNRLAIVLQFDPGRAGEADTLWTESLTLLRRTLGPSHRQTLDVAYNLALLRGNAGDYRGCITLLRDVYEHESKSLGTDHPVTRETGGKLTLACQRLAWRLATAADPSQRDPQSAVEFARQAVTIVGDSPQVRGTLGVALYRQGDYEESLRWLEQGGEIPGEANPRFRFFQAMACWQLDRHDDARHHYAHTLEDLAGQPVDDELLRFQREAEELLQLDDSSRQEVLDEFRS